MLIATPCISYSRLSCCWVLIWLTKLETNGPGQGQNWALYRGGLGLEPSTEQGRGQSHVGRGGLGLEPCKEVAMVRALIMDPPTPELSARHD